MKNTKAAERPATAMNASTTADSAMLVMMMRRRPIRSDMWPAIGVAANPAACSVNMQPPTQTGE